MSIGTFIFFNVNEGELEKFTQVYHDNPYRVITSSSSAILDALSHKDSQQGTVVIWKNAEERDKCQASEELKAAVSNVQGSGLLAGPPTFRVFNVAVDYAREGTSTANAGVVTLLRFKIKDFDFTGFQEAYLGNIIPFLQKSPEVYRYIGGIDTKEGEWCGACFYSTEAAAKSVTSGEEWEKAKAQIITRIDGPPFANNFVAKHIWTV